VGSPKSIIQQVQRLLECKNKIPEMGYESRKFAENVHNHVKVAQKYIDTWNKY